MRLSDLDSKNLNLSVVLLQTPSVKLQLYLQDKIKAKIKCKPEAIIEVNTKTDIKKIKDVMGITPPFSDKWYVPIDLDKLYDKTLIPAIKSSYTCVFFCTCSKYSTFKRFKEDLKDKQGVVDLYIDYLRRIDFLYLYDAFTLSDNKLTKQMFDYVAKSYSGDIEAVFELLIHLNQGEKFETRKDISDVCGLGGLSIEGYIFDLLKDISGSARGLDTVLKNRTKAGVDLGESLGYTSMYNFMSKCILNFCQLKELIMAGVVYKSVRSLPDSFDEKALAKYQKYIWRLKEIPMSELLRLRQCLGKNPWRSELDLLNFVYKYYNRKAQIALTQIQSAK
jgi:hypothetical protein